MSDLISRQDAIDALDDYILDETTNLNGDSVREILEGLPSAQPEQRWIPTRIAKPPKAGQYLVTKQQKTGVRQIATAYYNPSFDEWSGNGNFTKVLAWQQLPTPYTQE